MRLERIAESFDALKKQNRIKTMICYVERGMSTSEIAEEIDMSPSTVRKYRRDLEDAEVIEESEDGYSYTEYGEKLRASLEIMAESQNLKWLKKEQDRVENLRSELKAQRKRMLKRKIFSLV